MSTLRATAAALTAALTLTACVPSGPGTGTGQCVAEHPFLAGRDRGGAVFAPGATTVAVGGDVLMHYLQQSEAASQPRRFAPQFDAMAPYLRRADIAVVNLEGPAARNVTLAGRDAGAAPASRFDGTVYTGYPAFNYHPSVVAALSGAGVDVVQTANNHAMDRGPLGADRTLAAIRAEGLAATGTRARDAGQAPWHAEISANGHRIAFLACSYDTNGRSDPQGQVLRCFDRQAELLATVSALSARADIDAVILLPHWGAEYSTTPTARQRALARAAIAAGAAAVVGTHPHVLQPIEAIAAPDGRRGFVAYSLGNFISSQWSLPRRSSVLLYFDLVADGAGGLRAAMPRYLPTRVNRYAGGIRVEPAELAAGGAETLAHVARVLGPDRMLSLSDLARLRGQPVCATAPAP